MNIIKCALQAGGIGTWKCWFLLGGRKPENPEEKTTEKTQPTYDTGTGTRTQATLVEGKYSHHCAISAPLFSHITSKRRLF